MMRSAVAILAVSILLASCLWDIGWSCSESVCGSRVSKCMLIQSCNCTMTPDTLKTKNCSCCKECHICLDDLYTSCCSCVGMCTPPKDMDPSLTMKSYVEELDTEEDQTELFNLLTEDNNDTNGRWTAVSFPAVESAFFFQSATSSKKAMETDGADKALLSGFPLEQGLDVEPIPEFLKGVNCTVAFMSSCASLEKCRLFCQSMGASSYRWFHNGCCECVGKTCLNYGLREAKCSQCSENPLFESEPEIGFGNNVDEEKHSEHEL